MGRSRAVALALLLVLAGGTAGAQSPAPTSEPASAMPDPASASGAAAPSHSASPSATASAAPASGAPALATPGGTWIVHGFDAFGEGLRAPRRGSTLTVSLLPDGRLEGETACGTYVGGYTLDGERIRLAVLSRGVEPCSRGEEDEAFGLAQALGMATTWAASPTGVGLLDDSGLVRVALVSPAAAAADLAAEWRVETMASRSGGLVAPVAGTTVSLSFGPDGQATGGTGCRAFEADYSVEADRLVIAPVSAIGLPCEGDLRRQDRRLLGLLDEVVEWRRDRDRLILTDGSGDVLLEAVALSSAAAMPSSAPDA
jgi:heat shock protein HslJ